MDQYERLFLISWIPGLFWLFPITLFLVGSKYRKYKNYIEESVMGIHAAYSALQITVAIVIAIAIFL